MDPFADVTDHRLTRPDGRVVAWSEWGDPDGRPLLRVPGTPGSRYSIRADRTPWRERGLRVITTERPGYGASTPLPGRGFGEHADDVAAILDHLGLDRVHMVGGSGSAPHELMICQRHPERIAAATILVGIAPMVAAEVGGMVPLNQDVWRRVTAGDREGVIAILGPMRDEILADPLGAFRGIMASAPPDDQAVMSDPNWQAIHVRTMREALGATLDGWVDEAMALDGTWAEIEPATITTSITWQHAAADANCPQSAARRLVAQLPNARFVTWPDEVGHLYGYHHEAEILEELLSRG